MFFNLIKTPFWTSSILTKEKICEKPPHLLFTNLHQDFIWISSYLDFRGLRSPFNVLVEWNPDRPIFQLRVLIELIFREFYQNASFQIWIRLILELSVDFQT